MNPAQMFYTVCQVPNCGARFEATTLAIPIVGKTVEERATAYVRKLAEHMQKKHNQMLAGASLAMMNMFGIEVLKYFAVEDPALLAVIDNIRHSLFMAVNRPTHPFPDAVIVDRVARIGLDKEQQDQVVSLMKEMRDFLTEAAPRQPSQVVTPNGH